MISLKSILVVLTISTFAIASPYGTPKTTVKEKLSAPPVGWVHDAGHKIDKDVASIKLRINLVEQNMDKFHDMVIRVRTLYYL
jgi:tripeptidyl-peptidase-1